MNLVNALTSTLWEIDGHHHVLSNQGYKIPSIFSAFEGYNRPEHSKHRKHQLSNLSGAVLKSLSSHLFQCLHGGYWERDCWSPLKGDVELLAKSLAGYRDYLGQSSKKMKLHHSSPTPVRQLSESLSFQFLPKAVSTSMSGLVVLLALRAKLEEISEYEYVSVEDMCTSTDFRAKYNFIQSIKKIGFPFPTALLSYSHGNNVGGLHFIWKVAKADESSFSESQRVIEAIKSNIPKYHTRSMKKIIWPPYSFLETSCF